MQLLYYQDNYVSSNDKTNTSSTQVQHK